MISDRSNTHQAIVAFPGSDHVRKAKSLLRMAGFAEDTDSRLAIQRQAEIHLAAAQAARTVRQ